MIEIIFLGHTFKSISSYNFKSSVFLSAFISSFFIDILYGYNLYYLNYIINYKL